MKNRPASRRPSVVGAVGEVVAAAQQLDALVHRGVRQPDVGVHRDQRAVASLQLEVRLGELLAAGQRRALGPVAPDQRLLLAQAGAVPRLDAHVDPAGHEVGAVGEPGGRRRRRRDAPRRTCRRSVRSSTLRLAVPSLKPSRLRGGLLLRGGRGGAAEAELGPAHRHGAEPDPGEVADGVHRDLGVVRRTPGCTGRRRCGSGRGCRPGSAAARAAPPACGRRGRTGPCRRCSNSDGPNPNVSVSPEAGSPWASPVSVGGASYGVGVLPPTMAPAVIWRAAAVHSFSSATRASREVVVTSKDAKCSRSCAGVVMPAWCSPVEGVRRAAARAAAGRVVVRAAPRVAADARGARRERARAGDTEQAPSREGALAGVVGRVVLVVRVCHRVMAPVILESGSARAFTASESCLRCAGVTLS